MHSDNDCQVDFWIQWPHYEMDMSQNLKKKKKERKKQHLGSFGINDSSDAAYTGIGKI